MSLEEQIMEEIKTAMKARDKESLEALRAVKSALLLVKTEKGSQELNEAGEIAILQKLVKQRKDSAEIYMKQKRDDLYQKEIKEAEVIGKFLPEQMGTEELEQSLKAIIERTGASTMADMGKVMGAANKQLAGKADGRSIAETVKKLLST
ncbi:MAG: GatB/YqeY domain-containing protein [Bacteroidales bacterium]|nr:GatB/YqeY domain-containing protein [Bacteroidales bacterium]